ncbi:hypothetical protein B0J14DRAFT_656249 [Halenospora varia]|nr:hypothetical protein B0J14DRAFT_656249 [Halenospora varia]
MTTPSSPEAVQRKPIPVEPSPKYDVEGELKENKENIGRKPLPNIPIPSSGRIIGAPMSPVRVNVQPEDWPPRPSSGKIEGSDGHGRQISTDSQEPMPEQYSNSQPQMPIIQDMPYRPSYTTSSAEPVQQPQRAIRSSAESSSSRSSGSSGNRRASGRELPDRIDENGGDPLSPPVPRFQYHHQSHASEGGNFRIRAGNHSPNSPANDQVDAGASIGRHLTPTLQGARRTPIPRPMSAYSDMGPRGRSPSGYMPPQSPNSYGRAPSAHSGRSYDSRPVSYVDLANMSYPQAAPAPISLDNSPLRDIVGSNASLLSMSKTLEMYRQNVKKLNDAETQYAFAIFLIQAAQEAGLGQDGVVQPVKSSPKAARDLDSPYVEKAQANPQELLAEAKHILQKLASASYPFAQYYLADGFASGLFSKGKEDYGQAFPLFQAASKHGHAESGYRTALCYEFGWGCRKDLPKAVKFFNQAASKNHPGAMTRLGRACLTGELGLNKYREGLKWLKRATESADIQYNQAPYHLAQLYVTGYGDDLFQDEVYAAQLFTQAADLGHAESCYILGDAYEHGKLSCPRDPALSVHFYTGAAQRGHPAAMMALCAWYMVGAEPVLEKDENEAYEWARQAAECGLTKAEYAVGYFTEMGIGTRRDPLEANVWYVKAADAGDDRAKHRLAAIRAAASGGTPMEVVAPRSGKMKKSQSGNEKTGQNEKDCIVM